MSAGRMQCAPRPRVLFFGTRGAFSGPPLAALLDAGVPIVAVVLPSDPVHWRDPDAPPIRLLAARPLPDDAPGALPMLAPEPLLPDLAREGGIPLLELARPGDPAALAALAALRPDLICVACFPRSLPPLLLALPRRGCLNLHPSLLPRHRGPAPLFWTFYHGDAVAGVTIHIMDEGIDTGDLLLQAHVPVPEGTTGPELERACAAAGAALLVTAVREWSAGALTPRPQRESDATAAPWPTPRDLEVPLTWSAGRAFRFIRGVSAWYPLTLPVPSLRGPLSLRIQDAQGVEEADALPPGQRYRVEEGQAWVRLREGVLRIALLAKTPGSSTI
jgi:methionyl-tRNA formyltransferase